MDFGIRNCCANPMYTIDNILRIVKKEQVHEINKGRRPYSEYHHVFPLLKQYNDKFETYMRMKLHTFQYILSKVEDSLKKNWCNLHKEPILPEEQLVVTIRCLATGASYSDLSFSFLMGKSTISYLIKNVCTALWCKLYPVHMPVPTTDIFMDIAQDYYVLWDMRHCVGAIDVRHVKIKKPSHSRSLYYNYKKFFSITLQAVVDARYKFVVIDVGGYGHQHDATTFRYSSLYRALQNKKLKLPEDDELYDSRTILPYFFIADGAYPLSRALMKPYPGEGLSRHQKLFNKRLSRARVCVECAFGRLCQKYRIFYKPMEYSPKTAQLIVKSACILHNVIIDCEKPVTAVSPQLIDEASILQGQEWETYDVNADETNQVFTGDGQMVKRKLIKFFINNSV